MSKDKGTFRQQKHPMLQAVCDLKLRSEPLIRYWLAL